MAVAVSTVDCCPAGVLQQRLGSAENDLCIQKLGLELRDRRFLCLYVGLERSLLEPIERLILLDLGTFGEESRIEKGRHPRDEIDPFDRLNTADIFAGLGDRLANRGDDAYRGRFRRGLLASRGRRHHGCGQARKSRPNAADGAPFHAVSRMICNGTV